jgi:hypothetical protein
MPASAAAPINTGSIAQFKAGDLAIGSNAVKYWLTQSGQSFALKNNAGAIKLIVGQDGNVGIGTTAPAHELTIGDGSKGNALSFGDYTILGSAYSSGAALLGNMVQPNLGVAGYSKSTSITIAQAAIELKAGVISFATKASDANAKGTAWDMAANTKMTILNTGNVGIGTTGPLAKLAVAGTGSSGVTTGSSGDTIAAYAKSANSALYAEQQNSTGGGYAGYFKGDVNITRNLFVGGNINATGTINSATALCVNSVCANSTVWNTIVSGAGSGGSIVTNLGFTALAEGGYKTDFPVSLFQTAIYRANLDPISRSLIITTADFKNSDGGNDNYKDEYVLDLQKNDYGNYEIKRERQVAHTRLDSTCAKAGNYVYCGFNDKSDSKYIYRGDTAMTLDEPDKVRALLFSDGVYLYLSGIYKNAYRVYKYEINGTNLISKGYVTISAINNYTGVPLATDGSYIYAYVSGEKKIKRYNFSDGSLVKEWSVPVKALDFFFIENNRFITGSAVFGYGGEWTENGGDHHSGLSIIGLNFYDLGAVD